MEMRVVCRCTAVTKSSHSSCSVLVQDVHHLQKKPLLRVPKKHCNRLFTNNSVARLDFSLGVCNFMILW